MFPRFAFRAAIPVALALLALADARAAQSGSDPRDTTVAFTIAWAKRLRGFHTLADLQRAAGGKGACAPYPGDNDETWQQYRWRGIPRHGDDVGYMLATIKPDGSIGVAISTTEDVTIVINTNDAFICDKCMPAIDIEPPGLAR